MKKFIHIKYLIFIQLLVAICLLNACTKSLDNFRKDPEAVDAATPSSFLTNSLFSATSVLQTQCHTINNQLMQVSVLRQNDNEIHRYIIVPGNYSNMWTPLYQPLANIDEMLRIALKTNNNNYAAIALTLKSWIISNITDIYGDVPFTEASKGSEGITTPKYDDQKTIYDSVLVYLDKANTMYNLSSYLSGEDLLYNANTAATVGNMLKWKKFTNSLRLRLLMRVQGKSAVYQQMIKDMLANPAKYPIMTSVSDGAAIYYTGVTPYLTPFFGYRDLDFNSKYVFSAFFINYLTGVGDPRLPIWATKPAGGYLGLQTGYPTSSQSVISNTSYSTYQLTLKNSPLMGSILQYAEVEFLLAEACLKGYITDNPKTHYDKAIKASMDYWGVANIPTSFLNNSAISYDGTLKQIITQKYFALFMNGFEQWADYRRTSFPVLDKGIEMQNNGVMPSRIPYPTTESLYNSQSYNAAVAKMGGDGLNQKMWWMP